MTGDRSAPADAAAAGSLPETREAPERGWWAARAGSYVYEPAGDVHTLVTLGDEEMITLFLLEGVIQYLDDGDSVVSQDDVFTKLDRYLAYCRREGIEPVDLRY